jgi:hypothetical protein
MRRAATFLPAKDGAADSDALELIRLQGTVLRLSTHRRDDACSRVLAAAQRASSPQDTSPIRAGLWALLVACQCCVSADRKE